MQKIVWTTRGNSFKLYPQLQIQATLGFFFFYISCIGVWNLQCGRSVHLFVFVMKNPVIIYFPQKWKNKYSWTCLRQYFKLWENEVLNLHQCRIFYSSIWNMSMGFERFQFWLKQEVLMKVLFYTMHNLLNYYDNFQ